MLDLIVKVIERIVELFFPEFVDRIKRRPRVRWVKSSKDGYLAEAFEILRARIPEQDRDHSANICDWLDQMERWRKEVRKGAVENELEEYLLLAIREGRVLAFLYASHYFEPKLAFLSYLCTPGDDPHEGLRGIASLLRWLEKRVNRARKGCTGVVFEVDDSTEEGKNKIEGFGDLARRSKGVVGRIRIDYLQPVATPAHIGRDERHLALMYAPLPLGSSVPEDALSVERVKEILDFVYRHIYWDHYDETSGKPGESQAYRAYLTGLQSRVERTLPASGVQFSMQ